MPAAEEFRAKENTRMGFVIEEVQRLPTKLQYVLSGFASKLLKL